MKESYGEGVATHTGPESCVVVRKGDGEALTGGKAGRVLSREISTPWPKPRALRGADAVRRQRKATPDAPRARGAAGPRAVRDPVHARTHRAREPGDSASAAERGLDDRIGKSEDVRR